VEECGLGSGLTLFYTQTVGLLHHQWIVRALDAFFISDEDSIWRAHKKKSSK
jgi:hypothetical protein